jgi:hypothetical protein
MSRRWVECRVCGAGFSPRTLRQDVCDLRCFCRDPRRQIGYPMMLRQGQRKRMRRAA